LRVKNSRFSITLPVLGPFKIEKAPNLGWKDPWKDTYIVVGEVNGEPKGAFIFAVEGLTQPIQVADLMLNYFNMIWMPKSELELPINKAGFKINFPPESLDWNRLLEVFGVAYCMNTLLHEFLHLWVRFESREIDEILGAESEEFYNIIEDFLIQLLLLKKAKKGLAFRPSWMTSKQQLLAMNSPSFIGKMHVVKVLQGIGCLLSSIEALPHRNGEFMEVIFHFSDPSLKISGLELTDELLLAELVAYIKLLAFQRPVSQGYMKFDIRLPVFVQNILDSKMGDMEVLQNLAAHFVRFGDAFLRKGTLKPFEDLHRGLIDFLALKLAEGYN
jgi:hypothetical protein